MKYDYLVPYHYKTDNSTGIGRGVFTSNRKIKTLEDIQTLESKFKTMNPKFENVVVLNATVLRRYLW